MTTRKMVPDRRKLVGRFWTRDVWSWQGYVSLGLHGRAYVVIEHNRAENRKGPGDCDLVMYIAERDNGKE